MCYRLLAHTLVNTRAKISEIANGGSLHGRSVNDHNETLSQSVRSLSVSVAANFERVWLFSSHDSLYRTLPPCVSF